MAYEQHTNLGHERKIVYGVSVCVCGKEFYRRTRKKEYTQTLCLCASTDL